MPPSGFSPKQTSDLISFLQSCADALLAECRTKNRTPRQGLRGEIQNIDTALPMLRDRPVASAVLVLTQRFYTTLLDRSVETPESFVRATAEELYRMKEEILGIHVPS